MKRIRIIITIFFITICLTGCENGKIEKLEENINKMELMGNLITYKAYYHNVAEYEKKKGNGIENIFEKDRELFIEYTGTINLGIDLSKVKVDVKGNKVNVFIPKAKVIGEPNVDEEDFRTENFIESQDGFINKNPITIDDSTAAFNEAQNNMKENALKNEELLSLAQTRAKVLIEENIREFSKLKDDKYSINWKFE